MNFLTTALPSYMRDSLLCFTPVNSKVLEGAPDIATCNSNGYMYEIKNKKVIRSLNIVSKGTSISCSYLIRNEKLELYYLVLTEDRKLLIIRRTRISFQIMKTYEEVKEFEVYDFECLGFPQIKIKFIDRDDDLVCTFPIEEPVTVQAEDNKIVIDEDNRSNPLMESLEEKLQILNKHIDELSEEYNLLRKQFSSKESPTEFGMVPVGSVKFSSPLKNGTQSIIKISDKWLKVFGSNLVLGIRIHNCSNEIIQDVEILIMHQEIRDYSYRTFQPSVDLHGELFSTSAGHQPVRPGDEIWLIGAFRVPAFLSDSSLSVPYWLTSADLKTCLAKDSFEVTVLGVASQSNRLLEEGLTVEDLMALRTVKSETHLRLRGEDLENDMVGVLLVNNLGFRKIKHVKDELFYCTSGYLNEVFVALRQITVNPSVWEMLLLTSEESQIYFLVNALYDLLPESTAITC